jgi:hypothetical protein
MNDDVKTALKAIDAVRLSGLAAGEAEPWDGFRQGWQAARDAVARLPADAVPDAEIAKLRAALRQISVWPGDRKLVASICEIALATPEREP